MGQSEDMHEEICNVMNNLCVSIVGLELIQTDETKRPKVVVQRKKELIFLQPCHIGRVGRIGRVHQLDPVVNPVEARCRPPGGRLGLK